MLNILDVVTSSSTFFGKLQSYDIVMIKNYVNGLIQLKN